MPEAQLTEPLDHAAEIKETFAALEAAVEADVDARLLRRGSMTAQELRDPLADSSPSSARHGAPMPTSRTIQRPETIVNVTEARRGTIEGDGLVVLTVKGGRIDLTPEEADKLADHLTATADQSRQPASVQTQRQRRITVLDE